MNLDKAAAKKIAKKLEADVDTSARNHEKAVIYFDGVEVAAFGIRRGKKGQSHWGIHRDLHVTPNEAKRLATCPMTRDEWVAKLVEAGLIVPAEPVN